MLITDATPIEIQSPAPPGGAASGGQPQFIETLSRAAVAAGMDGALVEDEAPERALSDEALRLDRLVSGFAV